MEKPDPKKLLEETSQEEKKEQGRLKIFLGYAEGAGKTYTMLEAAHKLKDRGADVVIGYLEPHARPQIMEMAEGLEYIPVKQTDYKNAKRREMDLDAVLKRRPEIVLIDEYAHINDAGSRHQKRYQDVEEILKAGISVYTTVNVQNIESLCDIVASITGVVIEERIPDWAFDRADEVRLVDIEPEHLLRRLSEGKIYGKDQIGYAMNHFFTIEKLTALREIALRRTADRVNLITERTKKEAGGEYYTEEKILVGISSSPSNPKIIRTAARMAQAFGGILIGLYVETRAFERASAQDKKNLQDNLQLAEQLGAKIETVCGEDVPFLLAEYARTSGISKIVTGRSAKSGSFFRKASFTDKLSMYAPDLDIYVIPDQEVIKRKQKNHFEWGKKIESRDVFLAASCLGVSTVVGYGFYRLGFSDTNTITVYILGVLVSAVLTSSRWISLLQSAASILVFNYLFTEPRFSLKMYDAGYPITLLITFVAALLTSNLALKMKTQAAELAKSAYRTKIILDTNQMLQNQKDMEAIGHTMSKQLSKVLNRAVVYYGWNGKGLEQPIICDEQNATDSAERKELITSNERAVAEWVFNNNKRAGASTGTLSGASCYYLAVRSLGTVYGVVGIQMKDRDMLNAFESNVVMAVLSESATVMEREFLRLKEQAAIEKVNSEKLRADLLRSISHDLRTPLTSICGNADMLLEGRLSEEKKKIVYNYIQEDSVWLLNLVENLLSVTRIEDGGMKIRKQADMLEDLIEEALKHISRKSKEYKIQVKMEDELQLVSADSRLILQVLINIIDNAVKYTPLGGEIIISTQKEGHVVHVRVADNGNGISEKDKPHVFEMFYTAKGRIADSKRSLGLGLALCKSIVEAHGGMITVYDNVPKGTVFDFTLPTEEVEIHE